MAFYLNTNASSINAQRNLSKSTKALDGSYKKLASGRRINSAMDDAAGLQIADRMTSQIQGLTQGNRNANDGISLCQVAEGALDEVTNMLQRLRVLAIQSSNGSNSDDERIALQEEANQLTKELNRVGTDTTYGSSIKLFSSEIGKKKTQFQVGADANQTISLDMLALTAMVNYDGQSVTKMSLSSDIGAQESIEKLDEMLKAVDSYRGTLGAVQNRLESTISNQENVIENVSDAKSRIQDVDYASETAKMAQQNILQQVSTSILSQANQKGSIVMNLLG